MMFSLESRINCFLVLPFRKYTDQWHAIMFEGGSIHPRSETNIGSTLLVIKTQTTKLPQGAKGPECHSGV